MDGELIFAIIFYAVVAVIIFLNRKKFEVMSKILLVYKTKKPIKWMDKLAKYKRFWKIYGTICIPLGFLFMYILMSSLIENAVTIALEPGSIPGVTPLIPGIRIPGSPLYVPLFYGLIGIIVLAFVHEFAHGILARVEGLNIKSTGFGIFLIFPLFFVEPDNKQMQKASRLKRLRIASAGPGTNIILSFLISLLITSTFMPFFEQTLEFTGLKITSLIPDYPAESAGLMPEDVIIGVNGVETLNLTKFSQELVNSPVGSEVTLNLNNGVDVKLKTAPNPRNESLPYFGFYIESMTDFTSNAKITYSEGLLGFIIIIFDLLKWIAFINLMVGIMNLLPVWGLDGGLMTHDIISYFIKKKKLSKILTIIYSISLAILIWNFIGPYFMV